jgi:hypothetical protein
MVLESVSKDGWADQIIGIVDRRAKLLSGFVLRYQSRWRTLAIVKMRETAID